MTRETEADRAEQWAMMAGHIRTIAGKLLTEFFDERCPDFEADCPCCERWAALDALTENPFRQAGLTDRPESA